MTQIESIRQNIHDVKKDLYKYRQMVCSLELDRAIQKAAIESCLKELKELKADLSLAIKQN